VVEENRIPKWERGSIQREEGRLCALKYMFLLLYLGTVQEGEELLHLRKSGGERGRNRL